MNTYIVFKSLPSFELREQLIQRQGEGLLGGPGVKILPFNARVHWGWLEN